MAVPPATVTLVPSFLAEMIVILHCAQTRVTVTPSVEVARGEGVGVGVCANVGIAVGGGGMGIPGINLVKSETEQANMDNSSIMIKAGFRIRHLVELYFTSTRQAYSKNWLRSKQSWFTHVIIALMKSFHWLASVILLFLLACQTQTRSRVREDADYAIERADLLRTEYQGGS